MTAKMAFLAAVETVVARCLVPVPSAPLMALSEAIAAGAEAVESDTDDAGELERLWDLYDAAENVGLSWNDFGKEQALVDPCAVQVLADALQSYKAHCNAR